MRWQMAPDSMQGSTDSGGFACSWEAAEPQYWTAPWELPFVLMAKASCFCLPSNPPNSLLFPPLPPPPLFFYQIHTIAWQWFLTGFPFCTIGNRFALLQFLGREACVAFPYWPPYLRRQQQHWQCWKLDLLIKLVLPLLAGCQRPETRACAARDCIDFSKNRCIG